MSTGLSLTLEHLLVGTSLGEIIHLIKGGTVLFWKCRPSTVAESESEVQKAPDEEARGTELE